MTVTTSQMKEWTMISTLAQEAAYQAAKLLPTPPHHDFAGQYGKHMFEAGWAAALGTDAETYHLNSDKSVAVSNTAKLSKAMADCPRGAKVLLLGAGGVLTIGQYDLDPFWVSWCALPGRAD